MISYPYFGKIIKWYYFFTSLIPFFGNQMTPVIKCLCLTILEEVLKQLGDYFQNLIISNMHAVTGKVKIYKEELMKQENKNTLSTRFELCWMSWVSTLFKLKKCTNVRFTKARSLVNLLLFCIDLIQKNEIIMTVKKVKNF